MANVLLVLGNGFDINCGLESSLSQYLSSDYYDPFFSSIRNIDNIVSNELKSQKRIDSFSIYDDYSINFDNSIGFWDLYFGLPHFYKFQNIDRWYDFEGEIKRFIIKAYKKNCLNLYESITTSQVNRNSNADKRYKYDLILYLYSQQYPLSDDLLYNQLKDYEHRFGLYIHQQQKQNHNYINNARNLINNLINKENNDNVTYINNFNYSDLNSIVPAVWHINGDSDNPIFGIDLPETDPQNKEYKYTKTYRRLELTGKKTYSPTNKKYNKVIVFGHSLNEQDYSYFYSLFNILDLSNNRYYSNNTDRYIEFAYCKHGDKSSEDVRQELVSKAIKMFYRYNQEVLKEGSFRLVDVLFSSGAIRFKEIDPTLKHHGAVVAN